MMVKLSSDGYLDVKDGVALLIFRLAESPSLLLEILFFAAEKSRIFVELYLISRPQQT